MNIIGAEVAESQPEASFPLGSIPGVLSQLFLEFQPGDLTVDLPGQLREEGRYSPGSWERQEGAPLK